MSTDLDTDAPMRHELWTPYRTVLEQIVDAIAAIHLDVQLERNLATPPSDSWRDFRAVFRA